MRTHPRFNFDLRLISMNQFWRRACLFAGILPTFAYGDHRTDLNAFLDDPVSNTAQLVHEVQTKSDVRDRYLRHFGMTRAELYSYLGGMHLSRLAKSADVTVYSVPGSGAVRSHRQRLRAGDLVFIDAAGNDALVAKCGNPLLDGPSNIGNVAFEAPTFEQNATPDLRALPVVMSEPEMVLDPRPAIAMCAPPDAISDIAADIPPVTTTVVTAPGATTPVVVTPVVPAPLDAPPTDAGASLGAPAGGGGSNPLVGLVSGGVLIGILSAHHSEGAGLPNPSPAPEPAGYVCLAAGAISFFRRRRN